MISRKYTTKIAVWNTVDVPDGYGGFTNSEVLVKSIWAEKRTTGAGYKFRDFGLNDFKNPIIFSVRGKNNLNITENHFIIYKGKKFQIKAIENVNFDGLEIIIYADET